MWAELLAENDFAPHELVTLTRSLRWFDISDRFLADAEQLQGREHAAKVKSAGDASATALRLWKALKWTDPSAPTRNPGRPAKPKWHPLSRLPEDV